MVITPDGSTLVIAESFAGRLSAFDIAADGSLSNRRTWAEGLGPDGICIDADGGIWVQTADTVAHTQDPNAPAGAVVRVLDGGEITHRVETDLAVLRLRARRAGGPAPVPAVQRVRGRRPARGGARPPQRTDLRHRGADLASIPVMWSFDALDLDHCRLVGRLTEVDACDPPNPGTSSPGWVRT